MAEKKKICISVPIRNETSQTNEIHENIINIEAAIEKGADLIECRFDFMTNFDGIDVYLDGISSFKKKCIYTLRPFNQGGNFVNDLDKRSTILKKFINAEPQFVDIEYEIISANEDLADFTEVSNTKILVSWHDFEKTPSYSELINIVNQMRIYSPYLKVVTMAQSFDDVLEIFKLYQNVDTHVNLISFAMGESGIVSRLLCPIIGEAPFTYAASNTPIAPGQLSIQQVNQFYAILKKKLI